jgi:hypothetical protein
LAAGDGSTFDKMAASARAGERFPALFGE